MTIKLLRTGLGLSLLIAAPAFAAGSAANGAQAMRELNLIVLGNMQAQGGEVEGKAFVGGTVTGNSFQVGFGSSANASQGLAQSARPTWTAGNQPININVLNGSNGGQGLVGDFGTTSVYGAAVQGNAQSFNLNAQGGTVRVGGDMLSNLNIGSGTAMYVTGSLNQGANLGNNVTLVVGGNAGQIQGGNNGNVSVRGNVQNLGFGSGGTAQIGGNLNQLSGSNNQTVSVFGNIFQGNAGSNSTIKAGGSINGLNGTSGVAAYAGGSISGNTNGGSFNPNFAWNASITAPTVPAAPVAPDVSSQAAVLDADLKALSTTLAGLTVSNFSQVQWLNGTQTARFNAVDGGNGYAVFNVGANIFQAQQFEYTAPNNSMPIIINVSGASSYFMAANFIGNQRPFNQQVIWNFGNATSVTLDRQFQGSVLAPWANVQAKVVEGTMVAANYTMQDEVHLGAFKSATPFLNPVNAVPEPASWALLVSGFGLAGLAMRRRRPQLIRGAA